MRMLGMVTAFPSTSEGGCRGTLDALLSHARSNAALGRPISVDPYTDAVTGRWKRETSISTDAELETPYMSHKQKRPLVSGRLLSAGTAVMLVARARFELATFGL